MPLLCLSPAISTWHVIVGENRQSWQKWHSQETEHWRCADIHRSALHRPIDINVLHFLLKTLDVGLVIPSDNDDLECQCFWNTRQVVPNCSQTVWSHLLFLLFCSFCALSSSSQFLMCLWLCTTDQSFLLFKDIRMNGTKWATSLQCGCLQMRKVSRCSDSEMTDSERLCVCAFSFSKLVNFLLNSTDNALPLKQFRKQGLLSPTR